MDFEFDAEIYAHMIDNPPHADLSSDIDITVINSSSLLQLVKLGSKFQTKYQLKIEKPLQIGFTNSDQNTLNNELRNLILAVNLAFSHTCITLPRSEFSKYNVRLKPLPSKPATVERKGNHYTVHVEDTIALRDEVHIGMNSWEDLDEKHTIELFQKIQKTNRFKVHSNSQLKEINLGKALKEYDDAMTSFDRLAIFKHLYNSIEMATNWDGQKREGSTLDAEIAKLASIAQQDAQDWRDLYNRTKHVDRTPAHTTAYIAGMDALPSKLVTVRQCSRTILISRLP